MGKLQIALAFFSRTSVRYWWNNLVCFAGIFAKQSLGVGLFEGRVLRFGQMKVYAAVEERNGLSFLYEICVRRSYDSVPPPPGDEFRVVFDVGANSGCFALSKCLENCRLAACCFEPHPATFSLLEKNITLNQVGDRISAIHAAVGASTGTCYLAVSSDSSMGVVNSDAVPTDPASPLVEVPMVSLDDFATARNVWPDVIKIDVEGYEVEVLRGAPQCLAKARRVLLEYHGAKLLEQCLTLLEGAGFTAAIAGTLVFADKSAIYPRAAATN